MCSNKAYSTITAICSPVCLCAASTCFLAILHLTTRMTTTVHTNISSTSVNGITALRMMMVDIGKLGCCHAGVAVTEVVGLRWMDEKFVAGSANIA